MRCLVVGGTGFLGGAIADALIEDGHSVSVMTRGNTKRKTNPKVSSICADRYDDLGHLGDLDFEWVFDTCAFSPDAVETLLDAAGSSLQRYVLISSISAYGKFLEPNLDEETDVPGATTHDFEVAAGLPPDHRASAFAYGSSYGPLKRACEIKASRMLGERATSLRVGLLVGAGDYTDRLTWWVRRIDQAHGGNITIPAPAPRRRLVQMIDVRDAARFALRCATDEQPGIWNVTGEPQHFADVLDAIVTATKSPAKLVWVDEDRIVQSGVRPWTDIPMMAPSHAEFRHFLEVSTQKARRAGLSCRSLEETLVSLIAWDRNRRHLDLQTGMTPEQELLLVS